MDNHDVGEWSLDTYIIGDDDLEIIRSYKLQLSGQMVEKKIKKKNQQVFINSKLSPLNWERGHLFEETWILFTQ